MVKAWGWRSFTIIYETNEGLVRLQELLKAHGPSEFPITVRQLSDSGDYRPLLKQIKNSAESHIVLGKNFHDSLFLMGTFINYAVQIYFIIF